MSRFAERYQTDKTLEEEGAWVDLGDGIKIKVARTRSQRAHLALTRLYRAYKTLRIQIARMIGEDIRSGGQTFRSIRDTFGANPVRREVS